MHVSHAGNSEVSILNRILRPNAPTFSPAAAQDILALDFDQADKERMRQLSAKARAGTGEREPEVPSTMGVIAISTVLPLSLSRWLCQ